MKRRISTLACMLMVLAAVAGCSGRSAPGGEKAIGPAPPTPAPDPEAKAPGPAAADPSAGAAIKHEGNIESIHKAAIQWIDRAIEQVDMLVPAAEGVVDKLIAGGQLYVVGNEGFCDELHYRAGGFSFVREWKRHRVGPNDVVLMGHFKTNDSGVPWIRFDKFHRFLNLRNGLVIHFTSLNWPAERRVFEMPDLGFWGKRLYRFDTGAPAGESAQARALGQMATTALAWAFQAEMIAAASRKGKTLATYASDHEPLGKGWDATVRGLTFHPEFKLPTIPPGQLGREYLNVCRDQILRFATTQGGQVRLAAERMAACVRRGGMIWLTSSGEIYRNDCLVPRSLPVVWLEREYNFNNVAPRLRKGDVLLWLGYIDYPTETVDSALKRGCDVVTVSLEEGPTDKERLHIRGCWDKWDSAVDLPNYPVRVLPSSGVVQTLQWYSLLAETAAACKAAQEKPKPSSR